MGSHRLPTSKSSGSVLRAFTNGKQRPVQGNEEPDALSAAEKKPLCRAEKTNKLHLVHKEPEEETEGAPKVDKGSIDLSEADKKRLKEELLEEMLKKKKGDK